MFYSIAILTISALLTIQTVDRQSRHETFYWVFSDTLASIDIPPGYREASYDYGEGILTTLSYADSSYIVLHYGFSMSLPLLKSPEHLIYGERTVSGTSIRFGRVQHTKLRWREDSLSPLPINIGFSKVPRNRLKSFENALESFMVIRKM